MKYRSSTEIINKILETVFEEGATKTRIMLDSYLSYTQLVNYLDLLQNKGLLHYEKATRLFLITDKGRRFMELYKEIDELAPPSSRKGRNA